MDSIRVRLAREVDDSYDILIGESILDTACRDLTVRFPSSARILVADSTVAGLYGGLWRERLARGGCRAELVEFPAGEGSKSLACLERVLASMRELGTRRGDLVVALGGGVTGDLAGLAAGLYMRGLEYVQVPTSLLAQVDSSVGGKVAVNIQGGKNYCGLFHQPRAVYVDPLVLGTLPEAEYVAGLAEVVKYGAILDAPLLDLLEANVEMILAREPGLLARIVRRCCELKRDVVEADEREGGHRMILNFGHTAGHAVETLLGLSHGQAVAYGMKAAGRMAVELGMFSPDELARLTRLLDSLGLARERLTPDPAPVLALIAGDKKASAEGVAWVLPQALGRVVVRRDVPPELVRRAVAEL